MSKVTAMNGLHPDLHVVHSIPGRIRLRAHNLYGKAQHADNIVRKLSAINGLHEAEASPTTGSITMRYDHSALNSVGFFAEVAAALALIEEGLDPSSVQALFKLVGTSPAELAKSLDENHIVLPIATFALGLFIGRQFA